MSSPVSICDTNKSLTEENQRLTALLAEKTAEAEGLKQHVNILWKSEDILTRTITAQLRRAKFIAQLTATKAADRAREDLKVQRERRANAAALDERNDLILALRARLAESEAQKSEIIKKHEEKLKGIEGLITKAIKANVVTVDHIKEAIDAQQSVVDRPESSSGSSGAEVVVSEPSSQGARKRVASTPSEAELPTKRRGRPPKKFADEEY